jgi:hypothetical protein
MTDFAFLKENAAICDLRDISRQHTLGKLMVADMSKPVGKLGKLL